MKSLEEVRESCLTLADFHVACKRNGFYVPALHSRLATREFLQLVRRREIFVPQISDVKLSACAKPPSAADVRDALVATLHDGLPNVDETQRPAFALLAQHISKRPGDKEWMMNMLSTLTQG